MSQPPAQPGSPHLADADAGAAPSRPGFGPGGVFGLLLLFVLLATSLHTCAWLGYQVFANPASPLPQCLAYIVSQLGMLGAAVTGWRYLDLDGRQVLGVPRGPWGPVILLTLAWLAWTLLEAWGRTWAFSRWPGLGDGLPQFSFAYAVIPLTLLGPIAEELFFRGVLCEGLARRYGNPIGIGASALLFALGHFHWVAMPGCLVFGVLMGWLQQRSSSLLPCIALHMLTNALALATSTP